MAPSVPMPESRPTTAPVWSRLESWSLTTIGLTADSTAAGAKTVTAASIRATAGASEGPTSEVASRIVGVTSSTSAPPTTSSGPIIESGGRRSAAAPPDHAPKAIAASASPMTLVLVSRVMPT